MPIQGLPTVVAKGYLQRDAEFRKINDQGGFLKFTIRCYNPNGRTGERLFASYYSVERWITESNDLLAQLTNDTPVTVSGTWKISKGKQGSIFHSIDAEEINILEE